MGGQGRQRGTRRVLGTPLLAAIVTALAAPSVAGAAITIGDAEVRESGAASSASFTVTRVPPFLDLGGANVSFQTADGSARAPGDYVAASGGLRFAPLSGTQSQTITITIQGDALDEPTESFRVLVSGSPEIADGDATGTILDDDPAPALAVADAPATAEGTQASFSVQLSKPSGRDVSVSYATADATATAAADYGAATGRLTIPAGATAAAVAVAVLEDPADEPTETFELRLASPSAATLGDATAVGTILDNDEPPPAPPPPPPPPPPVSLPATGSATTTPVQARMSIARPRLRRPSTVLVTLSCPKAAISCKGRVSIFSKPNRRSKVTQLRKERRLGRKAFRLAGGRVETLELALSPTDRRLLQRSGRIGVRAYAVVEDGVGRTSVRTANGMLVARLAHSGVNGAK